MPAITWSEERGEFSLENVFLGEEFIHWSKFANWYKWIQFWTLLIGISDRWNNKIGQILTIADRNFQFKKNLIFSDQTSDWYKLLVQFCYHRWSELSIDGRFLTEKKMVSSNIQPNCSNFSYFEYWNSTKD